MKTKFEKLITTLFNSEEISPNDKLSGKIRAIEQDELTQDELELVAAAGSGYYDKFKCLYMKDN